MRPFSRGCSVSDGVHHVRQQLRAERLCSGDAAWAFKRRANAPLETRVEPAAKGIVAELAHPAAAAHARGRWAVGSVDLVLQFTQCPARRTATTLRRDPSNGGAVYGSARRRISVRSSSRTGTGPS